MGFFSKKASQSWGSPGSVTEITKEGIEEYLLDVEKAYLSHDSQLLSTLLAPDAWLTEKRRYGEAFVERKVHRHQFIFSLFTVLGISHHYQAYEMELSEIISLSSTSAKVKCLAKYKTTIKDNLEESGARMETLDLQLFNGRIVCVGGEIINA